MNNEQAKRNHLVFLNGCFDVIHPGHIAIIEYAKSLGDVLVIGINSDESVKRLKGPTRPINSHAVRIAALHALKVYVVRVFNEDTPEELIRQLKPDIHVMGSDHRGSKFIDNTVYFERLEGYSSTAIIEAMRVDKK
jgi:D-beta-D-heptose 7-phosphate kinase/D-beta-D-heptose 1-phosphate adenosyltransferase